MYMYNIYIEIHIYIIYICIMMHTYMYIYYIYIHIDRQIDTQIDRQIDTQIDRQIQILYIYIYKRTSPAGFFYTIKKLRLDHIHHVPSGHLTSATFKHFVCHRYIWYIFSLVCSVSIIQLIYNIMCLIRPNDGKSIFVSFETVSLNILVHDVINSFIIYIYYIYIHIYIEENDKVKP